MKCQDIMSALEELSPVSYAEDWDNVGLIVGRRDKEVRKIYIAVDPTDEVIQKAVEVSADMIITHHPLIFKGIKKVNSENFISRRVLRLARHDISYYAMHTNFDIMGMADAAADDISTNFDVEETMREVSDRYIEEHERKVKEINEKIRVLDEEKK